MNPISTVDLSVRYAETDQMGVAYHANYLVWCDVARTGHLREHGVSYRELERNGLRLVVVDARVRFRSPLHFDDRVRIRCWVRDVSARRVEFGYAIETQATGRLAATARTALLALDSNHARTTIPDRVRAALDPIRDPVRL